MNWKQVVLSPGLSGSFKSRFKEEAGNFKSSITFITIQQIYKNALFTFDKMQTFQTLYSNR